MDISCGFISCGCVFLVWIYHVDVSCGCVLLVFVDGYIVHVLYTLMCYMTRIVDVLHEWGGFD